MAGDSQLFAQKLHSLISFPPNGLAVLLKANRGYGDLLPETLEDELGRSLEDIELTTHTT